jgi:hypothetical protein
MARKRSRKRRSGAGAAATQAHASKAQGESVPAGAGGYSRSRAKDEEARARLKPLAPGERPTAVTVGAIAAALLAVANVVALAAGFDLTEGNKIAGSVIATAILVLVAIGMWLARYWAVLGMQTLLALTIIAASLALLQAINLWAAVLAALIIAAAATLFWFLVKAMARIQMPARPGSGP